MIVDDMEVNRAILAEGFKEEYDILEAEDGLEAIDLIEHNKNIAAILLDLIMPNMDGMEVLAKLSQSGRIDQMPVFIITASESEQTLMSAYDLGAVDVISKPFRLQFIKKRISSIIELYRHRNDLENIVSEQVERINRLNQSMVVTLAALIESRDCESGEHVKRICHFTEILMKEVSRRFPQYHMKKNAIDKIVTASVLHDVGKIAIPDSILKKPGKLTAEEYDMMKLHTVKGCEILSQIPDIMDDEVYRYSYDICRYHHERWDGRGYPDKLSGDDIPIWAQVVSVADVYDALTSQRVYKPAFDHEKAVEMICNGECGIFNPKLLEAFHASILEFADKKQNLEKDAV